MWIPGKPRDGARYGVAFGKDAPAAPAAPDPVLTAQAQATANVDTAKAQAALNNVNQVTPYGNLTYAQTGSTDVNGNAVPSYTATTTLTPAQQAALDSEQSLSQSLYGLANDQTGRINAAVSQPFDMSKVPALPTDPAGVNQQAADAIYRQETSRLDPQWAQTQQAEEDKLAQQGITVGNQAYSTDMANLNRAKTDAYQTAQNDAITQGAAVGGQNFNEGITANQTGLQEQNFLREQPLNEAVALMGGTQIQNPSFSNTPQSAIAPTDVLGAYGLQQSARNTAYQGQVANTNSNNSAAAGLGAAALTAAAVF